MKALWLVAVAAACVSPAAALDREAFTITTYELNARVEPAQSRLGVRGRITLRNDTPKPQRIIDLQISSTLNWRSVRLLAGSAPADDSGQAVQFLTQPYTSDIDHTGEVSEAIVTLPTAVEPKGSVSLAIGYEGLILLDATRLTRLGSPAASARHSDWDQIGKTFTAVRGAGYVAWYPMAMEAQSLSEGVAMFAALGKWKARHATSRMVLNLEVVTGSDDGQHILANGKNCSETQTPEAGISTISGCVFEAVGWANPVFVAGAFRESEAESMRVHALPQDFGGAEELGKVAERANFFIRDWFGAGRQRIDVVDLADAGAAPFEAGNWLLLPLAKLDAHEAETLIVHQLAHAALASPRPWIAEGSAHLAQAIAAEKNGRQAALDFLEAHREAAAQGEQSAATREPLAGSTQEVFYRSKAVMVWWMLRDMVGDAALKRVLHSYRASDDTEISYLQHLAEAESKRDLGWFFTEWVYQDTGLPAFEVESANARATSAGNFVTAITVANTGSAGAEVPVIVHTATGDFPQRLLLMAKSKAVIRITTPAEPLEVSVNDGSIPEASAAEHRLKVASAGAK